MVTIVVNNSITVVVVVVVVLTKYLTNKFPLIDLIPDNITI